MARRSFLLMMLALLLVVTGGFAAGDERRVDLSDLTSGAFAQVEVHDDDWQDHGDDDDDDAWVVLPAGSVNGLQAAIQAAGPRGTVLVEAGSHVEEGSVMIEQPVEILGEPGAVIESVTPPPVGPPFVIEGALWVRNTSHVTIRGLELTPLGGGPSNVAILLENTRFVRVEQNFIRDYTGGVLIQKGDFTQVSGNQIRLTGAFHGIVVINGFYNRITDNTISQAQFGIWACDRRGHASGNLTTDSFIGIILCKVPQAVLISGELVGSNESASRWKVINNRSERNLWGYAATDGSHDNMLVNNAAADNTIDVEVLGDSMFFGFFTPSAYNTTIIVGREDGIGVHDCGVNTRVRGDATLIDTDVVPCF